MRLPTRPCCCGRLSRPDRLAAELRGELHAFLADQSPDAYERVVDALLARPQHGERWARHWMDVWRYADWAGFGKEVRDSQQHIWHGAIGSSNR